MTSLACPGNHGVRITIPSAVGANGDHWGAVESGTLPIVGLPHQPASMDFQQSYVGVPGSAGSDAIYCHDHNDDGFTLIVE